MKSIIGGALFGSILLVGAGLFFGVFPGNESALLIENVTTLPVPTPERASLPVRLKIPHINVDAAFEYVGITPNGAMDVPKDRNDVAWFKPGARPGEQGSAVIAGHYGRKNGKGSVFDNLHKLSKVDKVYVEQENGDRISFVVRESRRFDPDADASAVFGSSDGMPHLNLITCEGTWDDALGGYPTRLVVFTDKE